MEAKSTICDAKQLSSTQLDSYQEATRRTRRKEDDKSKVLAVLALGVAGEAGEVADHIKKVIGHKHALDVDVVAMELGDVLWYVASLADELGLKLSDIARRNIDKLAERYPNGFDEAKSRAR